MAWIKNNNKIYSVSRDGSLKHAKVKHFKSYIILHETTTGEWVKKVEAKKIGLSLTGQTKKIECGSNLLVTI